MSAKYERDYIARHEQIVKKLMEMTKDSGCVPVPKIAAELGMDQRTVKAHLKLLEVSHGGVFVNSEEKQFCTIEGVKLLARRLGLTEVTDEQEIEPENQELPSDAPEREVSH